jgi:hypothetical protein
MDPEVVRVLHEAGHQRFPHAPALRVWADIDRIFGRAVVGLPVGPCRERRPPKHFARGVRRDQYGVPGPVLGKPRALRARRTRLGVEGADPVEHGVVVDRGNRGLVALGGGADAQAFQREGQRFGPK